MGAGFGGSGRDDGGEVAQRRGGDGRRVDVNAVCRGSLGPAVDGCFEEPVVSLAGECVERVENGKEG